MSVDLVAKVSSSLSVSFSSLLPLKLGLNTNELLEKMPSNRKMKHKPSPRFQRCPPSSPSMHSAKPPVPPRAPLQTTQSRSRGSSALEQLPDKVLRQIFEQVDSDKSRNSATLRLSHRLLPFAIASFYHTLDTMFPKHIVNLYAVLRHRPTLGEYSRMFLMSATVENGGQGAYLPDDKSKEVWLSKSAKKKARRNGVAENSLDKILPSSAGMLSPVFRTQQAHWNDCTLCRSIRSRPLRLLRRTASTPLRTSSESSLPLRLQQNSCSPSLRTCTNNTSRPSNRSQSLLPSSITHGRIMTIPKIATFALSSHIYLRSNLSSSPETT